jgi:Tfp pilus assembly protein PilX
MSRLYRCRPSRRLARPAGDEGVALLFVVMAVLILATLSLVALGAIIVQVSPTQFQRKSNETLNAAETGLNSAASAIRNATYVESGTTYGDRSQLPCWAGYTGQVGDPSGVSLTYTVTIQYFSTDPTNSTAAWRTANALLCVSGIGTQTTPSYAFITSAGSGPALPNEPASVGNRTLQSVYTLSTTNPNLPGGLIKDSNGLCYTGSAVVGTVLTLATCLSGSDNQMWAYSTNYLLVLTSTRASDGTGGICLSATPANASVTSVNAVMKACNIGDYTQKWGVNGSDPIHFFGHLTAAYGKSWCLGPVSPGTTGGVLAADSGTCGTANRGAYPAAAVGAGAAGTTTKTVPEVDGVALQWVNYQEFGRCIDITGWSLTAASHIIYPCKQDPMAGSVAAASPGWNEVFTWNSSTRYFYANAAGSTGVPSDPSNPAYCMKSPNTNGGYVGFSNKCSTITASTSAAYTWTMNRDTGVSATSYTIVDSYGRCLSNGPKNPSLGAASSYSSVITTTCNGSTGQKWNAPASLGSATLGNTLEIQNH